MLTFEWNTDSNTPLYEQLYLRIKQFILDKTLSPGEKLPSKRQLSMHLKISVVTVENAYNQLMSEGYIYSKPKSGFFVTELQSDFKQSEPLIVPVQERLIRSDFKYDFNTNAVDTRNFPFSVWAKIMREVLRDKDKELLDKSSPKGLYALRIEIAKFLKTYRGISCQPEQIVVGAGSEYLINLIIQLLGKQKRYAVENPGYGKIAKITSACGMDTQYLPLDEYGISMEHLMYSKADVLHVSPSHQFPSGITTPIKRRYEILQWASNYGGYIIEDDYDSEFRYAGRPVPALQSLDDRGRVIYMNTFAKTLAPSLRIGYMVLPWSLVYEFDKNFTFYSNTVSCFEQYTLAKFMSGGYFERHLNRMRNIYRMRILAIKESVALAPVIVKGESIGLHLVLELPKTVQTSKLVAFAREKSIRITDMQSFYATESPAQPSIVLGYTGITVEGIKEALSSITPLIKA